MSDRKAYRITGSNSMGHPIGTICYRPSGHDYGLAADDSRMTGHPHVSMTLKENGDYPTFTIRRDFLEEVKEAPHAGSVREAVTAAQIALRLMWRKDYGSYLDTEKAEHIAKTIIEAALSAPVEAPVAVKPLTFTRAMSLAERGFETWKSKEHNAKWFKRIDGTPIPNDLLVNIAEAFCNET